MRRQRGPGRDRVARVSLWMVVVGDARGHGRAVPEGQVPWRGDEEGGGGKGGKRKRPNAKRGLSWLILLPTRRKPGQQHHDNAVPARQFEEFEALLSAVQRLDPGSTNKDWEAVAEDVAKVTGEPERSPSILFNKFKEAGTMFGGPSGMSGANHPRTVSIMSRARALCKLCTPLCEA